jgi:hypothetical protein
MGHGHKKRPCDCGCHEKHPTPKCDCCHGGKPYPCTCWPNEHDWLDGVNELPVSGASIKAFWDADILDTYGVRPSRRIIQVTDPFQVRFRVELVGELWRCMTGTWYFDVGFTAIGTDADFNLSEKVSAQELTLVDWKGCDTVCIERLATVPANTVPVYGVSTVFELAAQYRLVCCDGKHLAAIGYEALEEYQFYQP